MEISEQMVDKIRASVHKRSLGESEVRQIEGLDQMCVSLLAPPVNGYTHLAKASKEGVDYHLYWLEAPNGGIS